MLNFFFGCSYIKHLCLDILASTSKQIPYRRFWRADRPLSGNFQENVLILEEVYITDEERKKCQNVAEAFRELYELTDVVVVDAGKYGFVKLQ